MIESRWGAWRSILEKPIGSPVVGTSPIVHGVRLWGEVQREAEL